MAPPKIAFVTPEVAPFVKIGGLADVSAALPRQLHRAGLEVRVITPHWGRTDLQGVAVERPQALAAIPVRLGPRLFEVSVTLANLPGTTAKVCFLGCPPLYGGPGVYGNDGAEHLRAALLARAAIHVCQRMGFAPDLFHLNDWQTALLPLYLRTLDAWDRMFQHSRTLLTLHNLGYQGGFPAAVVPDLGLEADAHLLHQDDLQAGVISFLRTGILYASWLTTVSPTYAREIQTAEFGMGLADMLRARSDHLVGILNGIDDEEWDPTRDPHIPHPYSFPTIERKAHNRARLLAELGLAPAAPDVPVLGLISRLAYQKGLDLVIETLPGFLRSRDLRVAVLGSGEPRYAEAFRDLERRFRRRLCFYDGFSNGLAHFIEAGADIFLMPSRYEPCGLNQMYSLRYGTIPVVRRTGGLADTVVAWDGSQGTGTGFVFEHLDARGLGWALGRALEVFADRPAWRRMQRNGMALDLSWRAQARHYQALYAHIMAHG